MLTIRKATKEDVINLYPKLTEEDVGELNAIQPHQNILEVMLLGLDDNAIVCVDEENIVYSYGGNDGCWVWFLTSEELALASKEVKKQFIGLVCQHRDELLEQYDTLQNYVWSKNTLHKCFLESLGAIFPPDESLHSEFTGEQFDYFYFPRKEV